MVKAFTACGVTGLTTQAQVKPSELSDTIFNYCAVKREGVTFLPAFIGEKDNDATAATEILEYLVRRKEDRAAFLATCPQYAAPQQALK